MKRLLAIILVLIFLAGCSKDRQTYQIILEKNNSDVVKIKIDDEEIFFTENTYETEVLVGFLKVVSVYASYPDGTSSPLKLTIRNRGEWVNDIEDILCVSAIISRSGLTVDGCFGPGNGHSTSGTCYCLATKVDGTRCSRMVDCNVRYCWQHE